MKTDLNSQTATSAPMDDPPPWYAQCIQNIQALGGQICATNHCDNSLIQQYTHAFCYCQPPWAGKCVPVQSPPPGCCPNDNSTPVPVADYNCWCCCGCLANNTPVAFDKDQYKEIIEFQLGDLVYVADNINLTSFSQRPVMFTAGSPDLGAQNPLVKVTYGNQVKHDYLLVNRAQLFLTSVGVLKPASSLVPGDDSIVAQDGTPVPVLSLEVGVFNKGLHHVATSTGAATSPDGHLIVAKGMMLGDWALQVAVSTNQHPPNLMLAPGVKEMPEFGTKEYEAAVAKKKLEVSPFRVAVSGFLESTASKLEFDVFEAVNNAYIPEDAFPFLTPQQAYDIAANAPMASPSSQVGKQGVLYLFSLYGAFYPGIKFYFDEQNLTPNAYYFEEYGVQQVVVTGALARCLPLKLEGMALTIATMIGALAGGPPLNDQGVSCLGIASYSAVTSVMPTVWIGTQSTPIFKAGLTQVTQLFSYINKGDQGGSDTCMNISIDCRIQCMNAAFHLMPLPHCAGGPPDPALDVTGATGTVGVPHGTVRVSFNLDVDPKTASQPANYGLDPLARTFAAKVSPDDPKSVLVAADLEVNTRYVLTVTGVLSDEQQPLVPGENTATFTSKE